MHRLPRFLKRHLPTALFPRSLIIVIAPMVLFQAILTYVFFERHWDDLTSRLSRATASDIGLVLDLFEDGTDGPRSEEIRRLAARHLGLQVAFFPRQDLPRERKTSFFSILDRTISTELNRHITRPYWLDPQRFEKYVEIRIKTSGGVLRIHALRSRMLATNWHIFLVWMVGTSLILMTIAVLFLRNQVRPIERLAQAAQAFGRGRPVEDFKPHGAREVRAAAEAFNDMRERIGRQIEQRTVMLAGVSHDLKTPLTRFRLQLAMMQDSDAVRALSEDARQMGAMLDEYLAFARGEAGEKSEATDLSPLLSDIANRTGQTKCLVNVDGPATLSVKVRPQAIRRCITNLVENACAMGRCVVITASRNRDGVDIVIDDDGPGIPEAEREMVFRPFYRHDEARNQDRPGTGLGLSIARDIARGHGGDIILEQSPLNGLRARLHLPN